MITYKLNTKERLNYLLYNIPSKIYFLLLILALYFLSGLIYRTDFEFDFFVTGLVLLIASLIGLSFSYKRLNKLQRILEKAEITKCFQAKIEKGSTEINDEPTYQITYFYQVNKVPYTLSRFSTGPGLGNQYEEVLYNINHPHDSILMLNVPSGLEKRIREFYSKA